MSEDAEKFSEFFRGWLSLLEKSDPTNRAELEFHAEIKRHVMAIVRAFQERKPKTV